MRLIDADALNYQFEKRKDKVDSYEFIEALCEAQIEVDDAPTVDAVEVIRCGECRWYYEDDYGYPRCKNDGVSRKNDWYCADGERENDEDK